MSRVLMGSRAGAALALAFVLASGASTAAAQAAPPLYQVTDLGSLGGGITRPAQVNDRGMITGESTRHPYDRQGIAFFKWKKKMLGLAQVGHHSSTVGHGVNAEGTVVGSEYDGAAFVWTATGRTDLSPLGSANAINDLGEITGAARFRTGLLHAFRFHDGVMRDLGTLDDLPWSAGTAMNAAGDIVGWVGHDNLDARPISVFDGAMHYLGADGATYSMATGINADRIVCGTRDLADGSTRGWVWQAGIVRSIDSFDGLLRSAANAINDAGAVVGEMNIPGRQQGRQQRHAIVWRSGVITDLNTQLAPGNDGWVLQSATSINNRGAIVGTGELDGVPRAFLLTPL